MAVYEALTGTGEAPALAPRTPAGGVVAPRLIFASGARRRDESASDYLPSAKTGTGRAIKPKPDSNGTPTTTPKTPYSGKKRGRPSKAELAARAKAQAEAEGGAETGDKGNAVNEGVSTAAEGASSKRRKISTTESLSVDSPDALAGAAATGGPIQTPTPVKRGRGRPPKVHITSPLSRDLIPAPR